MDTERKMGYINERKRQQRREHKLRKFTKVENKSQRENLL